MTEYIGRNRSRLGIVQKCIKMLATKPEGNRYVGIPGRRWKHNILIYCKEIGWEGMAQHKDQWRALVNRVVNFRVP
jgi:hypothetical protein